MKDLSYFSKIYLAVQPVDFRKQMRGLSDLVGVRFQKNIFEERTLFVFRNKRRDSIRLLYWDSSGFAMWSKLLEKEKFKWIKSKEESQKLSSKELKWLLQGVDIAKLKFHEKLEFKGTY